MNDDTLTITPSPHGFATTLERVEAVLDARGLTVFARIDHAAGARAAGLDLRPTVVLLFGDPRGGTPVMQALATAGLDLPLRLLVFEDEGGGARIAWRDPRATLPDALAPTAEGLAKALAAITEAAISTGPLGPAIAGAAVAYDKTRGALQAQVLAGGQAFYVDEPVGRGGGGTGPAPHDLLAAGLAACTTMTVRLYAERKGWPLERVHVAVDHERQDGESPPDVFRRRLVLTGALDIEQQERLLQIADHCPVHRTLTAGARIETNG
jgi:putative redox protein